MTELPDGMEILGVRTPGLGDTTYIVTYDGLGILVDPQRDVDRFLDPFAERDVELRWVVETHLHNDYVSGGVVAAQRTGAELVLPAGAAPEFPNTPAFHRERFGDATLAIEPIHTPGHTPEHMSYLVIVEGEPIAVFSGGSLLVGSAGRPDLLGPERADTLARLQHGSVHRLAELPDELGLYPTHGEGSFCTVSGAGQTTSTIGAEKRSNPVFSYEDVDAFVKGQLGVLQPYPAYYRYMGPANLAGGTALPEHQLKVLSVSDVESHLDSAAIIDMRSRDAFAAGHIPSSLGIELADDFAVWVGWLVDIDTPLILVVDPDQDIDEARTQLGRIGYDNIVGIVDGVEAWERAGNSLDRHTNIDLSEAIRLLRDGTPLLDVRSPGEYEDQRVDGSIHIYLPDLVDSDPTDTIGDEPVIVACGSGYRANTAASLLQRRGVQPIVLASGGIGDLVQRQSAT